MEMGCPKMVTHYVVPPGGHHQTGAVGPVRAK
jgi:hypothetical protein